MLAESKPWMTEAGLILKFSILPMGLGSDSQSRFGTGSMLAMNPDSLSLETNEYLIESFIYPHLLLLAKSSAQNMDAAGFSFLASAVCLFHQKK